MANTCPICNLSLNIKTATPPKAENKFHPNPGDITTCFNCGEVLTFNDGLNLVPVTLEERTRIERDPAYQQFLMHVKNLPRMN